MNSIEKMTDICLNKMKPNTLWTWEKWYENISGNDQAPVRKTYEYQKFIDERGKLKRKINMELARRKQPERLQAIGNGKGIYLLNEEDVADTYVEMRVRRFVGHIEISNKTLRELATMKRLSSEDRKMLSRVAGSFELQGNALIGTIARMKSLPAPLKKRLLKKIGIDPKKIT